MAKTTATPGRHAALCVGINEFQDRYITPLRGCVNDAHDMARVLLQHNGFHEQDITLLTDSEATRTTIMDRLGTLVDEAKRGDLEHIVFTLASHGTQVHDPHDDEPDRLDQAFCPHDLRELDGTWDRSTLIVDDDLHDLFVQLPEEVLLEVFLDTCHSGDGLRGIDVLLYRRPRFVPPPSVEAYRTAERGIVRPRVAMLAPNAGQVLWAACRRGESSADARIQGEWHGAFTYHYCEAVRAAQNDLPRRALLQQIRAELEAAGFSQVPQLELQATSRHAGFHSKPGSLTTIAGGAATQPGALH